MDDRNGKILAKITEVTGSDEVWFNQGDDRYYLAASNCGKLCGGPVLGVIDAVKNEWLQNVPSGTGAHSVAANPDNNHIFVPISAVGGVSVFNNLGEDDEVGIKWFDSRNSCFPSRGAAVASAATAARLTRSAEPTLSSSEHIKYLFANRFLRASNSYERNVIPPASTIRLAMEPLAHGRP